MKKVGAIYSKTNNKENKTLPFQMPTRRKQSIDAKSNCTQASQKDITDLHITSTHHQNNSQFSHQQLVSDTQRYGQEHTFAENSSEDQNMDSLDIQQQKVDQGLKSGGMGILEKLGCLQRMFELMKVLRGLQRNRLFEKQLSVIENSLLNLQRQFIRQ